MLKDVGKVIRQIADFLGKPISDDAFQRVIEFSSIDSMKQRFHTHDTKDKKTAPTDGTSESGSEPPVKKSIGSTGLIRKGK